MLATEDHGKDLASVQSLLKKHQLMETDVAAHNVRLPVLLMLSAPMPVLV